MPSQIGTERTRGGSRAYTSGMILILSFLQVMHMKLFLIFDFVL
jgi:hypothetical protein